MSPLITVIGATGVQGGSVVDAVLKSGSYQVRAITRNIESDKAKALAARDGVELITANLNDEDSLIKAFEGSTAIYAVTNFAEQFARLGTDSEAAMKVEFSQGKNIADAASKTATLKHLIWSTLPNALKISDGKYPVPHFDAKAKVDDYIKSIPDLFAKTTFLSIAFYGTNLKISMFTPNFLKTCGKYVQFQPIPADVPMFMIGDPRVNVGIFALAILTQPQLTHGRYVRASVESITAGGYLETFTKATGKPSAYVQVSSVQEYDNLWPNWGLEMARMMIYLDNYRGEKQYAGEDYLTQEDLGITDGLVSTHDALKTMDWSFL